MFDLVVWVLCYILSIGTEFEIYEVTGPISRITSFMFLLYLQNNISSFRKVANSFLLSTWSQSVKGDCSLQYNLCSWEPTLKSKAAKPKFGVKPLVIRWFKLFFLQMSLWVLIGSSRSGVPPYCQYSLEVYSKLPSVITYIPFSNMW